MPRTQPDPPAPESPANETDQPGAESPEPEVEEPPTEEGPAISETPVEPPQPVEPASSRPQRSRHPPQRYGEFYCHQLNQPSALQQPQVVPTTGSDRKEGRQLYSVVAIGGQLPTKLRNAASSQESNQRLLRRESRTAKHRQEVMALPRQAELL